MTRRHAAAVLSINFTNDGHSSAYPLPKGTAGFDATLWRLGCWHLHGTGQPFVFPHRRLRDVMAACERLTRQAGCSRFVVRLHNRSEPLDSASRGA